MNPRELANCALVSAREYYSLVKKNKKSRSVVSAVSIVNVSANIYKIELSQKLRGTDGLLIEVTSPLFDANVFVPKTGYIKNDYYKVHNYDDQLKVIYLEIAREIVSLFKQLKKDEILFVYDLSFLIKNVGEWYRDYGHMTLALPKKPFVPEQDIFFQKNETAEQVKAIKSVLSTPVSYVWGPPGTGKTQIALADCIITYLKMNKPVLIVAPTNNAVEQCLRSVIKVLQKENIDIKCLYRLGVPSVGFNRDFPEICEHSANIYKIEQLRTQIHNMTKECEELSASVDYPTFKDLLDNYKHYDYLISEHDKQITSLYEKTSNAETEIKKYKTQLAELDISKKSLSADVSMLTITSNQYEKELKDLQKKNAKTIYKLLNSLHNDKYLVMESNAARNLKNVTNDLRQKRIQLSETERSITTLNEKINEENTNIERWKIDLYYQTRDRGNKIALKKQTASQLCDISHKITGSDTYEFETTLKELEKKYKIIQPQIDALLSDIEAASEELLALEQATVEARKNRLVYALTVDTFYSRYSELAVSTETRIHFNHLFFDEAAYCPMIKAGVIFSLGCPVALFGDHMQLPPICEASETALNNPKYNLFMWAQSALYFPELLSKTVDIETAYEKWVTAKSPSSQIMITSPLTYTHRFGDNLAKILDSFVYKTGFKGKLNRTEIIVIDAPYKVGKKKWTNISEANAIKAYLQKYSLSEYAILTPYKNQVELLKETLSCDEDTVMTVHRSQGKEWETVIISVCDAQNKFFTDSCNEVSKGLHVINTAISRAKENIVIVCDAHYWQKQSETQLVGCLVDNASKVYTYKG